MAFLLTPFLFRSLLGYDTYAFFSGEYHTMPTPPGAVWFFDILNTLPGWCANAVAYVLTLVSLHLLSTLGGVSPLFVLSLPYLFGYTFRLEDDQLAYPFLVASQLLFARGRKREGFLVALPGVLFWRGTWLYLATYVLASLPVPRPVAPGVGVGIGAQFYDPLVMEQTPFGFLLFVPLVYAALKGAGRAVDNLTLTGVGIGLIYPKWLWAVLPLLYFHAQKWWNTLPEGTQDMLVTVGILATILLWVFAFPQPWLNPSDVCHPEAQKPEEWAIGRWCEAHGYDMPFSGWPPSVLRNRISST